MLATQLRTKLYPSFTEVYDNIQSALAISYDSYYSSIVSYMEEMNDSFNCGGIFLSLNTSGKNYAAQSILNKLKEDKFHITCVYGYVDDTGVNHSLFEVRWSNKQIAQKALELI